MNSIFDKIIYVESSDNDYGHFMVLDTSVLYIGHTIDGWWYWVFDATKEDLEKEDFFDTVFNNENYCNEGYSVAYFNTQEELLKDIERLYKGEE